MEIVLASGNRGKLSELTSILSNLPVTLRAQADFDVPMAIEDGTTFIENALIKARNASACTGLPALADDSGIAVHALNGAPGIYSARYAGEQASDADNLNKLLAETGHLEDDKRQCRFICVVAYLRHAADPVPIVAQGLWGGRLLREAQGENGFGYDPIFLVEEHACSSAQLSPSVKNAISHRALALAALREALVREFADETK